MWAVDGSDRAVGGSAGRSRLRSARDDVLLTVAIVGGLVVAVAVAAVLLLRPGSGRSTCADDWTRLTAAVRAFQADGGGAVSEQALVAGTYLTAGSDYFDLAPDGTLTPTGPGPVACP